MKDSVTNLSHTVGFVHLDELDDDSEVGEVTHLNPDLLQDALDAAQALGTPSWNDAKILMLHTEGAEYPALAITNEESEPMAVMIASRDPDAGGITNGDLDD